MPGKRFVFIVTAALLAAVTACSSGGASGGVPLAVTVRATSPAPSAGTAKQPSAVLSASFLSRSTGWLLAEPWCASCRDPAGTVLLMRKTTDGGLTWFAVPAPHAPPEDPSRSSPPPDAVGRVLFTTSRDGWAFGPGLWRTPNGGATWQRVPVPGPVADVVVAGGRMLLMTATGSPADDGPARVYTAALGEDNWRHVAGVAFTGPGSLSLAVSGKTGYLLATGIELVKPVLLGGPVTGSAPWRPLPQPCGHGPEWATALAAAPGGWLFIGCGGEPGAGNQLKTAYLSSDSGHHWSQAASPPFGGYLGSAAMTAAGTIFLSGQRMGIYISGNRGRSWYQSPSLAGPTGIANAGPALLGTPVTDKFGVAVQDDVSTQQVWLTSDGGLRWTPVAVH
jgi:hypothetical protein